MSAKVQFHPSATERARPAEQAPSRRADPVLSCVRQVQADAEQILSDAADIEDARFIAENIIDTCRRALAVTGGTAVDARAGLPPRHAPDAPAVPIQPDLPARSKKAAARAKLDALSARELEIFTHLAEGRSAAEIAAVLSRSSKTINNHRTRILQKLGLKNATELVRLAVHSGLVSV